MNSFLGRSDLPRGLRNNNVGNLIITNIPWQGKISVSQNNDGHFEQFDYLVYGTRAMFKDIISDYNKGLNTLTSFFNEYAPQHENDTTAYVNVVSRMTNIAPNEPFELNRSTLKSIGMAIVSVENGSNFAYLVTDADYEDALDLVDNIPSTTSFEDSSKKKMCPQCKLLLSQLLDSL